MRVDGCIAAVDKEAEFAQTAAVADELVDVGVCDGRTGALECKVSVVTAECFLDLVCKVFDTVCILEVDGIVSAHFLGECQSLCVAVDSNDIFNTHRAENSDTDQTDRTAALNDNAGVEAENTGGLCAFDSVDQNGCRFDQNTGFEIELGNVEDRGAAADENVVRKPAVEVNVVIGKQTVNICAADILLVEVEHRDVGVVLEDHTGDNLIADAEGLASGVELDILTDLDDFTGAFVTECNGNQTEGVALEFVCVGTADTAAFNFDEDVIVADFGHRVFLDNELFRFNQHGNVRLCGNRTACGLACGDLRCGDILCLCGSGVTDHVSENLLDNFFNILRFVIHVCCFPFRK